MVLISGLMVANWWPCSPSSSLSTATACAISRRIVLALNRDADLFLLETVEHVGLRNGIQPLVVDLADRGLFRHVDVQDDALGSVLALDAHILEVAGVPQRVEVALHGQRVVGIVDVAEHAGQNCFLGDRRLPITRIWVTICCWAHAENAQRGSKRRRKTAACGELNGANSGSAWIGELTLPHSTGKICTPSLQKIRPILSKSAIICDRRAQTPTPQYDSTARFIIRDWPRTHIKPWSTFQLCADKKPSPSQPISRTFGLQQTWQSST